MPTLSKAWLVGVVGLLEITKPRYRELSRLVAVWEDRHQKDSNTMGGKVV